MTENPRHGYHVRNWKKYQHYKDRNPPWIKLHFELLASEDWVELDDASRVLAVACMLLASRSELSDGSIPGNPAYIKRVAYLNSDPDFKPLIACGFLVSTAPVQADASTSQADAITETEAETEVEDSEPKGSGALAPCEPDLKAILFGQALKYLVAGSGRTEKSVRGMIGRWIKLHGEAGTLMAISAAQRNGGVEPVDYTEGALRNTKATVNGNDWLTDWYTGDWDVHDADGSEATGGEADRELLIKDARS